MKNSRSEVEVILEVINRQSRRKLQIPVMGVQNLTHRYLDRPRQASVSFVEGLRLSQDCP